MKQQMCVRCGKRPAVVFVQKMEGDEVTPEGYCIQCAKELNIGPIRQMIDKLGLSDEDLETASEQMSQFMENMQDFDFGDLGEMFNPDNADGAQTMPFADMFGGMMGANDDSDTEEKDSKGKKGRGKKRSKRSQDDSRKFLNSYCTNLTKRAKDGKIDKIIGRETEIDRTVQILCRRTKNNPCLIGEPGVGKTAIAEGLAIKIAKGEVPARLADKEIYLLDLTALVAGTQFRGQFEGRIKGLVDEVKHEGNIILFIDEVHNLVGTGDSEGTMNAANILKPALSRGEIQVIGATTFNEYRKYIEKMPLLNAASNLLKSRSRQLTTLTECFSALRDIMRIIIRCKSAILLFIKLSQCRSALLPTVTSPIRQSTFWMRLAQAQIFAIRQ